MPTIQPVNLIGVAVAIFCVGSVTGWYVHKNTKRLWPYSVVADDAAATMSEENREEGNL